MKAYERNAPDRLYRVSFGPNGTALRSWDAANTEDYLGKRTFGHRWDDPEREFRSLYASSSLQGAFIEILQDLRPHISFLAGLQDLDLEPGEQLPPHRELDQSYFNDFYACAITVETQRTAFIDVAHAEIIATMRFQLAVFVRHYALPTIEVSTMLGRGERDLPITQAVARKLWESKYAGITALSSLGRQYENWTIFEEAPRESGRLRAELTVVEAEKVTLGHPDLIEALNALHMSVSLSSDGESVLLRANPSDL